MKPRQYLTTIVLAAAAAAASGAAWACGTCAEDKIAATYDYATVQRAAAAGRVMVYCEITGLYDAAKVQAAARRVRGLDPASLRISAEPAALSFALDEKKQSAQAALLTLQAALPPQTKLGIVRIVPPGGNP